MKFTSHLIFDEGASKRASKPHWLTKSRRAIGAGSVGVAVDPVDGSSEIETRVCKMASLNTLISG